LSGATLDNGRAGHDKENDETSTTFLTKVSAMTYVKFKPIKWTQEIRRFPNINVEGLALHAKCTSTSDEFLIDGNKFSDLQTIQISIFQGDVPTKVRENGNLSEKAIGYASMRRAAFRFSMV
jgi:hypothetical protein